MTTRILAAILVAFAGACGPSSRPVDATSTSTPNPTATATSTATPTDTAIPAPAASADAAASTAAAATPAKPPPAPAPGIRSAVAREPSGVTPLSAGAETVVDPASTFEIELVPRLADARIVLVDAAEAHVAAKDVRELSGSTRLTLAPEAPLVPGSRYVLRADGATQREMHDAGGRAFAPVGFTILAAGTPPPPEAKKPKKKRRAR